ncbi:TPA: dynamin family protein [Pseudomonas aeruginosa]|nr:MULTISPECIES: dynamin family protein [Pseudomonadaceae]MBH9038567.1 dynamin family protein [Pseudomonas aeruginosa]MCU9225961.1 dynamin family protein [Pseudomonas aeruginosa]MDU0794870.1 dynamin family protein [Pseudomonas aeruginosa]GBC54718.1 putative ATP/GTP binding protein [Stutzerimonas stutzeri]GLZ27640.1 hypothetical protein Pstu01_43090 [Stutzerimonas stutzeri]
MSDLLLTPQLEPALTRLKSIWPWGRKGLIEQLQQHITAADEHTVRMQALRQSIEAELARVNAELARAESDLEQWQSQHEQLQAAHSAQTQQLLERSIAYETLQETHKQLQLEYETLGNTAALIESRYNLVCNILNSKPAENAALSELKGWLAGEFARDVQRLELPADVTSPALEQANAIGLHAELISDSPALRTKFLVAVAGGFSSGKSSFVTSFMRKEYSQLLAKGIQPVTAIPTYVMPGCELSIYGHTSKGAHVELSKDEYAQLTHDFIANMGFSVKEIMPHVVIESPMPGLKHLAFIDMPGYDPAASDTVDTAADHGIASAALSEADAVIWLVALDSNGTLPANDLEFLLQHADDRPLYVVLNKADLRPLANLEAVIEEIKEHLEDSGIQFEGICAYSSTLAKELLHEGKSLSEVMNEWDHLSDAALVLHKDFDTLVTTLEKHSSQQLHKVEMVGELAHSLELDILEIAGSESTVFQTAQSRIKQLKELAESIFGTERSEVSRALENMRLCGHKLLQANFGQLTAPSQRNEAFTD